VGKTQESSRPLLLPVALGSQFCGTRFRPFNLHHRVPAKGVIGWMTEQALLIGDELQ
jgi:hypothetical protein